ncbi:MAG TPA: 1-acyl-sn-glycerol-3-phosphate acyltransferase [Gemmatimonadales bacterium]|nr:1-acyl-sn-glycerol-3-phosphate acyltransferase [Gemmatimonadales bacterium]
MWLLPVFSHVANAAARVYYRLTIAGERVPATGPVLLVANHPNSLVDPIVVCAAAGRPVRFLAKAPLFADPKTGWMVRAVGAIPVYRRSDDPALVDRNQDMFRAVYAELAHGAAVGIFPEGRSHSEPSLSELRTGAARIVLGTLEAHGVTVPIIPVGLVFRQKDVFRSSAVAIVGAPVPWADVAGGGLSDQEGVRAVTERIGSALRQVTLNLERWEDRPLVEGAVDIWDAEQGSAGDPVTRVERLEVTTRILADLRRHPDPRWSDLTRDVRAHLRRLGRLRLTPASLHYPTDIRTGVAWTARRFHLALPLALAFAVAGFLLFIVPYQVTGTIVNRMRLEPDTRSTWKLLLGLAIHGAWVGLLTATAALRWGPRAGVLVAICVPLVGIVGLRVRERWRGAWVDARRFFALRSRRELIAALREGQRDLAERFRVLYSERVGQRPS